MWSKFSLLVTCCTLLCLPFGLARPSVGAIRWDAWYWEGGAYDPHRDIVGRAVTEDISPERWHYRVPFFGKLPTSGGALPGLGNNTECMEKQNDYAASAGIDYWAFCIYPIGCKDYNPPASECPSIQCCADNYALSYALERYLESSNNNKVNFTLLLQAGWFPVEQHGGNETLKEEVARYVGYFQRPIYHRVAGNRPLVFLLGGDAAQVGPGIEALRNESKARGVPDPYVVYMGSTYVAGTWSTAKSIGADAISAYNVVKETGKNGSSFADNMAFTSAYWSQAKSSNVPILPALSAGWDPRPRELYPVPWGNVTCPLGAGNCFMQDPTMPQLTQQVTDALQFASANGDVVESHSILISAWNEHDEGHWIQPSLTQGTQKLDAVRQAIESFP